MNSFFCGRNIFSQLFEAGRRAGALCLLAWRREAERSRTTLRSEQAGHAAEELRQAARLCESACQRRDRAATDGIGRRSTAVSRLDQKEAISHTRTHSWKLGKLFDMSKF